MRMRADDAKREVTALLLEWCDALVRLQVDVPKQKLLDGGLRCPACGVIHGRCHEAVYPLLCAAHMTGNDKYLCAAKRLFSWGENMHCADGGFRNDFNSAWKGVTAFAAIALHDALFYHGDLLTQQEKAAWESRLSDMGAWLYENLTEKTGAYLNYYAANACAMALLGAYFSRDEYKELASKLAVHCMKHVSENGLIYGEGSPNDAVTAKGCRAIDVGGYNTEETLPCLWRYASVTGDRQMADTLKDLWRAHVAWMLPDGAWDDSTGTRSFKWTYWGSRTADGCQAALFDLGREDPVFAEAAWRNFELLRRCTHAGLLTGGPDYPRNGEPACVHHTFCHAKTLALAVDAGIPAFERVRLPSDHPECLKYYPELDVCRVACGSWRMDVCGYDFQYAGVKHVSGGSISLLWHEKAGPLIASGMVDFVLREPNNQQLSVHPETQRSGCPRLEMRVGNVKYAQHYCTSARLSSQQLSEGPMVKAAAFLCDKDGNRLPGGACALEYRLAEDGLSVCGRVDAEISDQVCYVLPLIGDKGEIEILQGELLQAPVEMFNLSPGFLGREYSVRPDRSGCIRLRILIKQTEIPNVICATKGS